MVFERRRDRVDQLRVAELACRQVDPDRQRSAVVARVAPDHALRDRRLQNELTDTVDESRFFCERDELSGWYESAIRVVPADQRFDAEHMPCAQADLRLVDDAELA